MQPNKLVDQPLDVIAAHVDGLTQAIDLIKTQ
jgi:hypothetical protein